MLIAGFIVSGLLLLGFTRLGVRAKRTAEGKTLLILRIGFLRLDLLKRLEKPEKKPKIKKREEKGLLGMSPLQAFRRLAAPLLRSLRKGLRVDKMELTLTLGGDPCDAALLYGRLHMAWGVLRPVLNGNLRIKRQRVVIGLDFDAEKTRWEGELKASLSFGRCLAILFAALGAAMKNDPEKTKEGGKNSWKTRKTSPN